MDSIEKNKVEENSATTIKKLMNDARPFDLIVFDNNISGSGFFKSITTRFIKVGSSSGWNHVGLIMDDAPIDEHHNNIKDTRESKGKELYIYEYAAAKQPVTYQKLRDKINNEKFHKIALVRFNCLDADNANVEVSAKFVKDKLHVININDTERKKIESDTAGSDSKDDEKIKINAKMYTKLDFLHREGVHAGNLSDRKKRCSLTKYEYDRFPINHRATGSLAMIVSILIIAVSFSILFMQSILGIDVKSMPLFKNTLYILLIALAVISMAYIVMNFWYRILRSKWLRSRFSRTAICSTYPLHVINKLLSGIYSKKQMKIFDETWLKGTPPSPKNVYKNAVGKKDYTVLLYKS